MNLFQQISMLSRTPEDTALCHSTGMSGSDATLRALSIAEMGARERIQRGVSPADLDAQKKYIQAIACARTELEKFCAGSMP